MGSSRASGRGPGWEARPGHALAVRGAILAVPLLAGVAAGVGVTRLASPQTPGDVVVLWIASFVVSNLVLFGLARQARRFLPLAALLELSLNFPDRTPSRVGVALRAGNLRSPDRKAHALRRAATASAGGADAVVDVLALAAALSAHDRATRGHSERVRAYSELLCQELHLPPADRERLRWASLLHDVGKMAVPVETLNKPGALDDDEWEAVKQHPVHGARLVASLGPWLGEWAATVEQHHERWDGTGYPHGLAGTAINRGARIVAVADAFEVMTATRSYKRPIPAAEARRRLADAAGTQFDPGVVRAFLNIGLGRLRLVTGPLAWLGQMPFLRHVDVAARTPAHLALGSMVAAAAVTMAVVALPLIPDGPRRPVTGVWTPYDGPPVIIELSRTDPPSSLPAPTPVFVTGPPLVPASTPPPPQAAPAPPPPQPDPHPPAPTPLVQVDVEVAEATGLAVGVGEGACTGLALGGASLGCPPATDQAPPSASVDLGL